MHFSWPIYLFLAPRPIQRMLFEQQVRIQDLVKGAQLLRPKVTNVVNQMRVREVSNLKWALEAFEFLVFKYAFSHILETLFL